MRMHNRVVSYGLSFVLLAAVGIGWLQRDAIFDAWRLRGYTASAEVAALADKTTMNDKARRLFYVYRPSLEDKASFNAHCTNSEQTIVLGCYVQHDGIYLYNVSDVRLNGVVEVTAAHEMLHAAYDRLSGKERTRIDRLTAEAASTITDERLKATIENYRMKDATVVPNELHSILATELRDLPTDLETYYKRYFTNRGVIVSLADQYKQEFSNREDQVKAIDRQISDLKLQIDDLNSSLEAQQVNLKANLQNMQTMRNSGDTEGYNAAVGPYNRAVVEYNTSVNRQKQLVGQYNSLVEQRNSLATEENELIEALDSRKTIQQQ